MQCSEARELFLELFKKQDFEQIGRLFKELKGKDLRCFEGAVFELSPQDAQEIRKKVREAFQKREGKERPVSPDLIRRVLYEGTNAFLIKRRYLNYTYLSILVRFRDGKVANVKTKSPSGSLAELYRLFGLLRILTLLNRFSAKKAAQEGGS